MVSWKPLATVAIQDGALELRQRGEREFLMLIAGRVLMTAGAACWATAMTRTSQPAPPLRSIHLAGRNRLAADPHHPRS